jgi:hypothetical protein
MLLNYSPVLWHGGCFKQTDQENSNSTKEPKMNKLLSLISAALCAGAFAGSASAAFIEASASCSSTNPDPVGAGCDQSFQDDYGFNFKIDGTGSTTNSIYVATLLNTSPSGSGAVIDSFFFNLNPDLLLGTDFSITGVNPTTWEVRLAGGGVQFDYEGDTGTPPSPSDRIGAEDDLTFNIVLLKDLTLPFGYTSLLDYFLNAETSSGAGAGGGDDSGEVAVSFQTLGTNGNDSDLLVAFWKTENGGGGGGGDLPEPGVLFLMGAGLLGLGMARRRKSA